MMLSPALNIFSHIFLIIDVFYILYTALGCVLLTMTTVQKTLQMTEELKIEIFFEILLSIVASFHYRSKHLAF